MVGWTAISGGSIEIWRAYEGITASNGDNSLELDHESALDGFSQSVTTAAGQAYTLTFDARLRTAHGATAATQGVEVVWNGIVIQTITPASGSAWTQYSVNVTGTGGSDTLTIREVAAQGSNGLGALLDNFALIANGAPAAPTLAISGAFSVAEGDLGTVAVTYTVTRSGDTSAAVSASYAVTGTGANAANAADFGGTLPSGTVSFAAGETTRTITVLVSGDTATEAAETFAVTLSAPTGGATISSATATGTILNDDGAPPSSTSLLINGSFEQTVIGQGGFANFSTIPGWTAISGGQIEIWRGAFGAIPTDGAQSLELDFLGNRDGFSQTVATTAGEYYMLLFDTMLRPGTSNASSQQVEIVWNGTVVLTVTPGASWNTSQVALLGTGSDTLTVREVQSQSGDGIGAMLDNFLLLPPGTPVAPTLAISGAPSVAEGNAGTTALTFTVTRTGDSTGAVSAAYAVTGTGANPANAADFGGTLPSGVVSFAAGETVRTITILVTGDTTIEAAETFAVTLTAPTGGAAVSNGTAVGTI